MTQQIVQLYDSFNTWRIKTNLIAGEIGDLASSYNPSLTSLIALVNDLEARKANSVGGSISVDAITLNGNLGITGLGRRIKANFSDTTSSNRTSFQTNVAGGDTLLNVIPDGAVGWSSFNAFNASDADNASRATLQITSTQLQLRSDKTGTGSHLPIGFYTSTIERMTIGIDGLVTVNNGLTINGTTNAVLKTSATGSAIVPYGTTAQRDASPLTGYFRYNTTLSQYEGYNGSSWGTIGGGATGGAGSYAFFENDITITSDYTITTGKNAMTAGPVTIADGVVITIPDGSTWTIV